MFVHFTSWLQDEFAYAWRDVPLAQTHTEHPKTVLSEEVVHPMPGLPALVAPYLPSVFPTAGLSACQLLAGEDFCTDYLEYLQLPAVEQVAPFPLVLPVIHQSLDVVAEPVPDDSDAEFLTELCGLNDEVPDEASTEIVVAPPTLDRRKLLQAAAAVFTVSMLGASNSTPDFDPTHNRPAPPPKVSRVPATKLFVAGNPLGLELRPCLKAHNQNQGWVRVAAVPRMLESPDGNISQTAIKAAVHEAIAELAAEVCRLVAWNPGQYTKLSNYSIQYADRGDAFGVSAVCYLS